MKIVNDYNINIYRPSFIQKKRISDSTTTLVYPNNKVLTREIAFCGGCVVTESLVKKSTHSQYVKTLAEDLSTVLNKGIKVSDLKSVMTKQEFLEAAKTLREENYISSPENIRKGIFVADFHSHSNFSDGHETVEEILNQAAAYADKLHAMNGKTFMFALSDHDGVEGIKEALKIIASNPEKYKNVRFLPAAELSFPTRCENGSRRHNQYHNDVEVAEMLIYDINPFSRASEGYFGGLYKKRANGIKDAVKIASERIPDVKFYENEYYKYYFPKGHKHFMMNQHWNIFQYVNLKARISRLAFAQNKNPEAMFETIMSDMRNNRMILNGDSLNRYLSNNNIPITTKPYLDEAYSFVLEIAPKVQGNDIITPYESSFESIVKYARDEDAFLAFAHPGFTFQNMRKENFSDNIKNFINNSDGRLIFAESYHQAYPIPQEITWEEIAEYNKILSDAGLIQIGGRDMHRDNFKFSV